MKSFQIANVVNSSSISRGLFGLTEMSTETPVLRTLDIFTKAIDDLPDNSMKSEHFESLFSGQMMDSDTDQVRSIRALSKQMNTMEFPLTVEAKVKILYGLRNMNHKDEV